MRVEELAQILQGKAQGQASREIKGVANLDTASPTDLTFLEGARETARAARSGAGCVLVAEGISLAGKTTIAVAHPKLAFIRAAQALAPLAAEAPGVHPTAAIAPGARLASSASIGPYAVIRAGAVVGEGTQLEAGVSLGEGVQVGSGCRLFPGVTVYAGARLGDRVILHAGVVVGSDGFGYVFAESRHHKFPQLGGVVIEDDVEIGSNTTVDRGSLGTTIIGQGTKIDNLVHIAHNVEIGRHCVVAAQTGISGSVKVGNYVVIGGQVGIGDHVRIEDHVVIGSAAGILPGKIVRKGSVVWGTPARPLAEFKRIYAHFAQLPKLAETVSALSRQAAKPKRGRSQRRRRRRG